ncbi:cofilin [Coemansia sp. RSA 1358]|nr:hypothetical protein BX070DRAFT_232929 [Coemansia spiralis]KAJ2624675.1 cofilin [Coemansia sp. RSA 1358]
MSSGISVATECIEKFNELKDAHKYRFVIYRISDDLKSIVVESTSAENAEDDYEEFTNKLPEDDGRYAIYDFEYEVDGGKRNKVLFYAWAPDSAKIKSKMLYASSKSDLINKLNGVALVVQATDQEELSYEVVLKHVQTKFR